MIRLGRVALPNFEPLVRVAAGPNDGGVRQRESDAGPPTGVASKQVTIKMRIEPLGWAKNPEAFERRATSLMRVLRSYFAAG